MPVELYFTLPGVLVLLEQTISQICKMEISLALQLGMSPDYKVRTVTRNLLFLPGNVAELELSESPWWGFSFL